MTSTICLFTHSLLSLHKFYSFPSFSLLSSLPYIALSVFYLHPPNSSRGSSWLPCTFAILRHLTHPFIRIHLLSALFSHLSTPLLSHHHTTYDLIVKSFPSSSIHIFFHLFYTFVFHTKHLYDYSLPPYEDVVAPHNFPISSHRHPYMARAYNTNLPCTIQNLTTTYAVVASQIYSPICT